MKSHARANSLLARTIANENDKIPITTRNTNGVGTSFNMYVDIEKGITSKYVIPHAIHRFLRPLTMLGGLGNATVLLIEHAKQYIETGINHVST